jgi:hypothetical protein
MTIQKRYLRETIFIRFKTKSNQNNSQETTVNIHVAQVVCLRISSQSNW